ncbi:MAG: FecR domain-containing protein [Deltaproteobacteria bacterium]|nr:FecR domain-containing protein [Deltaproteobacteria bacterium]MBW1870979.1 FecR domain-containing protein [Deltaproteobacteria bacterium]
MRDRLLFIVAVAAFIIAVPLVYYLMFERGLSVTEPKEIIPKATDGGAATEPVAKPDEPVSIVPSALSLTETEGNVEIGRAGRDWQPAEIGTVLSSRDRIRTDPTARAVLAMPGVFSVELDSSSEFEVKSLTDTVSRFLLEDGMISAEVVDNPDKLFEVEAADSLARTSGGSFKMSKNKQGLVALGTSRGTVEVQAAGKIIQVRKGFLTRIAKGKPPQDPIKVPSNLFLKVRWPRKKEMSARQLVLSGKTTSGSRVRVGGTVVIVDSKGRFRKVLALKEGANRVQIEAYDVGGNRNIKISPKIVVDTRGDSFQIRTSPEMWEKNKKK